MLLIEAGVEMMMRGAEDLEFDYFRAAHLIFG